MRHKRGYATVHQGGPRLSLIGSDAYCRRCLLTATGAGAASRFSIGLVVVAGMSIGTLFTLFVLPAVYVTMATDHRAKSGSNRTKEIEDFDLGLKATT